MTAGKSWRKTALDERIAIVERFLDLFEADKSDIGAELTREMGRPIRYGGGEVGGFLERGRHLVSIARKCLADVPLTDTDKPGFRRYIRREPFGVVLIISAWNVRATRLIEDALTAPVSMSAGCSGLAGSSDRPQI